MGRFLDQVSGKVRLALASLGYPLIPYPSP